MKKFPNSVHPLPETNFNIVSHFIADLDFILQKRTGPQILNFLVKAAHVFKICFWGSG